MHPAVVIPIGRVRRKSSTRRASDRFALPYPTRHLVGLESCEDSRPTLAGVASASR